VELCINGLITEIRYIKDLDKEGTISFDLPSGDKDVRIYLAADATMLIKNLSINDTYVPATKETKVLWIGDSITQGFGPLRSAHTYVSAANRLLNYDIVNQGIGGYVYDKNALVPMEGYKPDKIIIAMGTNQYGCETMKDIEDYYVRLKEVYGDIPVLCVTPLWRGDGQSADSVETLERFCGNLKDIVAKYPNITVVDGFKLVPHLPEYFLDNLHPNCLGTEIYARNLVEEIRRTGF
jgi:lysophospholipase L1-like esterase